MFRAWPWKTRTSHGSWSWGRASAGGSRFRSPIGTATSTIPTSQRQVGLPLLLDLRSGHRRREHPHRGAALLLLHGDPADRHRPGRSATNGELYDLGFEYSRQSAATTRSTASPTGSTSGWTERTSVTASKTCYFRRARTFTATWSASDENELHPGGYCRDQSDGGELLPPVGLRTDHVLPHDPGHRRDDLHEEHTLLARPRQHCLRVLPDEPVRTGVPSRRSPRRRSSSDTSLVERLTSITRLPGTSGMSSGSGGDW